MNYIIDYFFDSEFINSYNYRRMDIDIFSKSLNRDDLLMEDMGLSPHQDEMNSASSNFFNIHNISDSDNNVLDEFKDTEFCYKIDMLGGSNLTLPWEESKYNESIFDFISYKTIDFIRKNENSFILLNYAWEGTLKDHDVIMVHRKIHQYGLPPNRVVFMFAGFNQNEWYDNLCKTHGIKKKINFYHQNWVWFTKSKEFIKYKKQNNTDSLNSEYSVSNRSYDFNCLNRRLRTHRFYTLARLEDMGLLDSNIVTYNFNIESNKPHLKEIPEIDKLQDEFDFSKIKNYLLYIQKYKKYKTYDYDDLENIFGINHEKSSVYKNSMFTLVTETTYYNDEFYISEKTVKPMGQNHPFIVVGSMFTLSRLRELGFKTFSPFIDESYDTEYDYQKRWDIIFSEVKRLCDMTDTQKLEFMKNVKPIVEHNSKRLDYFYENAESLLRKRDDEIFKLVFGTNRKNNKLI